MVFALMSPGDSRATLERFAALPSVDGLAFRAMWNRLEPSAGAYDWSSLDIALDTVKARDKKLTIHVGASGGGAPSWLAQAGAASYSFTTPKKSGTDYVPWDSVFLDRHALFVSALSAHLRERGDIHLVRAVSDGAPVAEMSLGGCSNGKLGDGTLAYDRTRYLDAWKKTVSSHLAAFPDLPVFVSAPVSQICQPDNDGAKFYDDLMQYGRGLPGQLAIFAADLNAKGSARLGQVSSALGSALPIGLQTIWSFTNDPTNRFQGTLLEGVCAGRTAGARYFEIYQADLDNADSAVQKAIGAARNGSGCKP